MAWDLGMTDRVTLLVLRDFVTLLVLLALVAGAGTLVFRLLAPQPDEPGSEPDEVVFEQFAEGRISLVEYEELRTAMALRHAAA